MKQFRSLFSRTKPNGFKPGFTLSENLMATVIVGVVATLTVVTVVSTTGTKTYEAEKKNTHKWLQDISSEANLQGKSFGPKQLTPDKLFQNSQLISSLTDAGDHMIGKTRWGHIKIPKSWNTQLKGALIEAAFEDGNGQLQSSGCWLLGANGSATNIMGPCTPDNAEEQLADNGSASAGLNDPSDDTLAVNNPDDVDENLVIPDDIDLPDINPGGGSGGTGHVNDPPDYDPPAGYIGQTGMNVKFHLFDQCSQPIQDAQATIQVFDETGTRVTHDAQGRLINNLRGNIINLRLETGLYTFRPVSFKYNFDPFTMTVNRPENNNDPAYTLNLDRQGTTLVQFNLSATPPLAGMSMGNLTVTNTVNHTANVTLQHTSYRGGILLPLDRNGGGISFTSHHPVLGARGAFVPANTTCSLAPVNVSTFNYSGIQNALAISQRAANMTTWAYWGSGWDLSSWYAFIWQHDLTGAALNSWINMLAQTLQTSWAVLNHIMSQAVFGSNIHQFFTASGQQYALNLQSLPAGTRIYDATTGQPTSLNLTVVGGAHIVATNLTNTIIVLPDGTALRPLIDLHSPIKVALNGIDAKLNSTDSYLVDLDGQNRKGQMVVYSKGGLNDNEAWLVMDRARNGFWDKRQALDGDDIFGDHLGKFKSGYEDLGHTFKHHLQVDEQGRRYIQLHPLSWWEKTWTPVSKALGLSDADPSYDLKLMNRNKEVIQASDVLTKLYVDYNKVDEWDSKGENWIGQRASVTYRTGQAATSADQWFATVTAYKMLTPEELAEFNKLRKHDEEKQTADAGTTPKQADS